MAFGRRLFLNWAQCLKAKILVLTIAPWTDVFGVWRIPEDNSSVMTFGSWDDSCWAIRSWGYVRGRKRRFSIITVTKHVSIGYWFETKRYELMKRHVCWVTLHVAPGDWLKTKRWLLQNVTRGRRFIFFLFLINSDFTFSLYSQTFVCNQFF